MRHSLRPGALAATAVVLGALVVPVVVAAPAQAATYPTWQDVQAAKGNEASKQAEVGVVQQALQGAQDAAAAKSQAALVASGRADRADADLARATQQANGLEQQARSASETADRARQRAGQLAANLYRDGSTDTITTRIAGADDPDQLLYQLGAMDQLTSTWAGVMDDASVLAKTATSLQDQAHRAADERGRLAAAAEERATAAAAAQRTADAAVASTEQHSDELYAQLASLRDTTAQAEQQYAVGQAVAAQAAAQARAAQAAAERDAAAARQRPSGSAPAPAPAAATTGNSYPSTGGVTVDPAGAQAYARSVLGSHGWGADQMGCLVSLWTQESGWRANALNASSGAYGIPQALPASKMATAGADWRTNQDTQVDWGLAYIKSAYGSPCSAWNHELSVNPHWY